MAAMPARYAMERGAWREAMNLQVKPTKMPYVDALTFPRGPSGRHAAAMPRRRRRTRTNSRGCTKRCRKRKTPIGPPKSKSCDLTVAGWIALAQGNADNALKFMRAAADLEDKNEKSIVTPGRVIPARELLGDMLLELKQPAAGA